MCWKFVKQNITIEQYKYCVKHCFCIGGNAIHVVSFFILVNRVNILDDSISEESISPQYCWMPPFSQKNTIAMRHSRVWFIWTLIRLHRGHTLLSGPASGAEDQNIQLGVGADAAKRKDPDLNLPR